MSKEQHEIDYPECAKLSRVSEQTRAIGEFIEYLHSNNMDIAEWEAESPLMRPVMDSQMVIYQMYDIDPKKLEQERRKMLENI